MSVIEEAIKGTVGSVVDGIDTLRKGAEERSDERQTAVNLEEVKSPDKKGWRTEFCRGLSRIFLAGAIMDLVIRPTLSIWHINMMEIQWYELSPMLFALLGIGGLKSLETIKSFSRVAPTYFTDEKGITLPPPAQTR